MQGCRDMRLLAVGVFCAVHLAPYASMPTGLTSLVTIGGPQRPCPMTTSRMRARSVLSPSLRSARDTWLVSSPLVSRSVRRYYSPVIGYPLHPVCPAGLYFPMCA